MPALPLAPPVPPLAAVPAVPPAPEVPPSALVPPFAPSFGFSGSGSEAQAKLTKAISDER
jgi:hypothetical protein